MDLLDSLNAEIMRAIRCLELDVFLTPSRRDALLRKIEDLVEKRERVRRVLEPEQ
jgi:hypothetical protein